MPLFLLGFFLGSLLLCPAIGILLLSRGIFQNFLSPRMQYRLWLLFLGLLALPLLPPGLAKPFENFSLALFLEIPSYREMLHPESSLSGTLPAASHWMNDFFLPSQGEGLSLCLLLLGLLWLSGACFLGLGMRKAALRLRAVKRSSQPLKNPQIRKLYDNCREEAGIKKNIPLRTTALLKSPVFTGIIHPCIYLPLSLVLGYSQDTHSLPEASEKVSRQELRCLLLHELQHYRQKDAFLCLLMNLAKLLYWFHPLVRYALKEMAGDRELSCDASVLGLLDETEYQAYGLTLLHFAEQASLPFGAGLNGSFRQIRRRIQVIASYQKPTWHKKLQSLGVFLLTALLLCPFVPALWAHASDKDSYHWDFDGKPVVSLDLASYFEGYEGCFVLYDSCEDSFYIYRMDQALTRFSPNSTYKIYDALLGLEEGIIRPENSLLPWDGSLYPFDAWNRDQNLASAMDASVNWYFQSIDRELGKDILRNYFRDIGYGNADLGAPLSSYWMEASLKISPAEQVLLLRRLWEEGLGFAPEHVKALQEALLLQTSEEGTLYGKTGTGQIGEKAYSGWFVGCLERREGSQFFALYLRGDSGASGSRAARTALRILAEEESL